METVSANTINQNSSQRVNWAIDSQFVNSDNKVRKSYLNIDNVVEHSLKLRDNDIRSSLQNKFKIDLPDDLISFEVVAYKNYQKKTQTWKGVVIEDYPDTFTAKLEDLGEDEITTFEIAEFDKQEVSPADLSLLSLGAVFYWSVGYDMRNGQITKVSDVRFQRLVNWSEEEFDRATDRAEYFLNNISWD